MIAVIAAGGKGTRLSSIAVDVPKPMVEIVGKPILQYQIECLKRNGVTKVFILIGYLGKAIKDYFGNGIKFGIQIEYIEEKEPLGTAGSFYFLKNKINQDFIFVFGDLMFDIDFFKMISFHKRKKALITLLSHPNSHPFDSDLIISNKFDLVTGIDSKSNIRNYCYSNLVNSGVYIISNNIFERYFFILEKLDFEKNILRNEISNKTVFSYRSSEYVKDAGTPERYFSVIKDVNRGIVAKRNLSNKQKCIFLDRDGTLNCYNGFITTPDDICVERGVSEGLKIINNSEFLAIVITNQPVVARGDVTFRELKIINRKLETLLGEQGSYFNDLFFCPHHPDKGFAGEIKNLKIECNCRKPKIGLLLKAAKKYNIDLSESFFVGDTTIDIQTGINAGMKTILVKTGLKGEDKKFDVKPDYEIENLEEIKNIIGG